MGRDETLIRQYLFAVDPVIRHRANAADVRDELADHLIETVARLCEVGVDSDTAERLTPSRFGEPAVTAGFINAIPAEGHTVHTLFTREAGFFAFVAPILWVLAAVSIPFAHENLIAVRTQGAHLTSVLLAAVLLIAALLVAAIVSTVLLGWFLVLWPGLLIAATAITMTRVRASALSIGVPSTLLGLIWPALTVLVLVGVALVSPPQPAGTGTRIDSPRGVRRQGIAAGVPRLCRRPRGARRAPAFPLPRTREHPRCRA